MQAHSLCALPARRCPTNRANPGVTLPEDIMHERKKKDGQRKDKKNERMREAVELRKTLAHDPRPTTDQVDIQNFKPGSQGDENRHRPYPPK